MIYLGIDPGITGAIAVYNGEDNTFFTVIDMPIQERIYGKGNEIDWEKLLEQLLPYFMEGDITAVIENVGVMPRQGIVSAFAFGQVVGGLRVACISLGAQIVYIHPTAWKRKFALIGTDKNTVIEMVKEAYPESSSYLTLKKHHNRADAMAIAVAGSLL